MGTLADAEAGAACVVLKERLAHALRVAAQRAAVGRVGAADRAAAALGRASEEEQAAPRARR